MVVQWVPLLEYKKDSERDQQLADSVAKQMDWKLFESLALSLLVLSMFLLRESGYFGKKVLMLGLQMVNSFDQASLSETKKAPKKGSCSAIDWKEILSQ